MIFKWTLNDEKTATKPVSSDNCVYRLCVAYVRIQIGLFFYLFARNSPSTEEPFYRLYYFADCAC